MAGDWLREKTVYLCVNCKRGFDIIPASAPGECDGRKHIFVKRAALISDQARDDAAILGLASRRVRGFLGAVKDSIEGAAKGGDD